MRATINEKMTQKEFRNKRHQLLPIKSLSCLSLLLCLWSADGGSSRNYSEIVKLGSICPILDSCAYLRTASLKQRSLAKDRNCNCDPSCLEYGDCCVDATPTSGGEASRNDQTCLHVEQSGGVYMRDSCPPTFTGLEAIRNLCERVELGDQADPLASLPVTDPMSRLTYKNFYCRLCNGDDANDILMWTPKLECPLLSLLNKSRSITTSYILQNLATDGKRWGLYLNDESDGELFFHDCNVQAILPNQLQRTVRPCRAGLLSGCPPWWSDAEVKRLCKSYTGARYDADGNGYRNVHCAICNGVSNVSRLSCKPMEEVDIFRDFGTHSFAILLDVSQATGEEVGRVRQCKRGEVFDPFFKKCRSVSCLPGFVRRGRRCVMRNPLDFVKFYTSSSRKVTQSTTVNYQVGINATIGSEIFIPLRDT